MNLATLGKRIKSRRERCRLTQAQLALSLHITSQAVSKWERGENAPDIALLMSLSRILDVPVDWILSEDETNKEMFNATVFCTSMRNFAHRSTQISPKEVALWINGIFQMVTGSVLNYTGVPIKYVGDGFLAYFSGRDHAKRALIAARQALRAYDSDELLITLHTGEIFLGAIGHMEYALPDIMGDTVNSVFLMNQWATVHSDHSLYISDATKNNIPKNIIEIDLMAVRINELSFDIYKTII